MYPGVLRNFVVVSLIYKFDFTYVTPLLAKHRKTHCQILFVGSFCFLKCKRFIQKKLKIV